MQNKLEPIYKMVSNSIQKAGKPIFAVFDFDNTCITNDITEVTLAYLAANNLFRDKNLINIETENYSKAVLERYYQMPGEGKLKESYEFIAKILSGFSTSEIDSLVAEVLTFTGKNIKPREEVIELINFLKKNGVDVWVVSASPELLVRQAMKHFNIEANLIGVRNIIVDGKITDELEKPLSIYEGKIDCIKKYISQDKKPLISVGDSINDLPMLECCEIKVVVDRQNELAKEAKKNNWFLI